MPLRYLSPLPFNLILEGVRQPYYGGILQALVHGSLIEPFRQLFRAVPAHEGGIPRCVYIPPLV